MGRFFTSAGTVGEMVEEVRVVAYVHNSKDKRKERESCRTLILRSTFESVRVQRLSHDDSGIVEVHLDRPEAKNAIGKKMLRGLQKIFEAINRDVSANVVMLSSSTPWVFCASADLKKRKIMNPSETQFFVNSLHTTFSLVEALHVPTIVVIEGEALGGGLEMALSCDLHICGEDENTQLIVMFQHQTDQKYCIKMGTWFHLELVMQPTEKNIQNEIPSCNDYVPTLTCGSISVKVGNSISRENYLKGYTFLLEPAHKYNFGDRLQSLMESSGAKVDSIDGLLWIGFLGRLEARVSDLGRLFFLPCVIGKRPAKSSQPEARQKARFDTTLFSFMENYQWMGWLLVVTISESIFPTIVRAFYSRVTYGMGGSIISTSKMWPTVLGFEPREAIQRICGLPNAQGMGKPSAHSLTVINKVLHHMLCSIFLPQDGHQDEVSCYEAFLIGSILTGRRIHLGYLMMMHMISCCESTTRILLYGRFLTKVFKNVDIDLSKETDFEAPNTYDTYDDQSMTMIKFENALDARPSTQSSFTESSSRPAFTESPHIEIPPSQAPLTPDHAPWMDLSAQISSLGTHIEEFVVVSDTRFYFMEDRMDQSQHIEDRMDQHQAGFTS
ncbi:hypothetical protein AAG906_033255 [Vitis piasezkii]